MPVCEDDTWVTIAGADLLWLPPECRNGEVAIAASTIVIGCPSRRVVLLGIRVTNIQDWTNNNLEDRVE
jgi:hypothetical protein